MNTPQHWAKIVNDTFEGILKTKFPKKAKHAMEMNLVQWVFDICEDETLAIIRQIKEKVQDAPDAVSRKTYLEIVKMLEDRLPKRPGMN